jgi:hypothetical protein
MQGGAGRISSGPERPGSAFTAVHCRDHWFRVEDNDLVTKRVLAAINLFLAVSGAGTDGQLPLVTSPAQ